MAPRRGKLKQMETIECGADRGEIWSTADEAPEGKIERHVPDRGYNK